MQLSLRLGRVGVYSLNTLPYHLYLFLESRISDHLTWSISSYTVKYVSPAMSTASQEVITEDNKEYLERFIWFSPNRKHFDYLDQSLKDLCANDPYKEDKPGSQSSSRVMRIQTLKGGEPKHSHRKSSFSDKARRFSGVFSTTPPQAQVSINGAYWPLPEPSQPGESAMTAGKDSSVPSPADRETTYAFAFAIYTKVHDTLKNGQATSHQDISRPAVNMSTIKAEISNNYDDYNDYLQAFMLPVGVEVDSAPAHQSRWDSLMERMKLLNNTGPRSSGYVDLTVRSDGCPGNSAQVGSHQPSQKGFHWQA